MAATPVQAAELREALEEILPRVQRPSRYLGIERNLRRKPWDSVPLHVALAFPDAYEIGMSHQGSQILYHLINRREDALAQRCFAPWPDMAEALTAAGLPLYTLESYTPVAAFEVVGISLQSECNYVNIPYLLDLAGIARRAEQRADEAPLVLGGGPCTANPEPVADFFDALLIGDGEAALDRILDTVRDGRAQGLDRLALLRRLAAVDGVYVPRFYQWQAAAGDQPAQWEVVEPGSPMPVRRVWIDELNEDGLPEAPIVPAAEVVQERVGVEIMRGCTQGCRFCQAGFWYRPVRERDPELITRRLERQVAETGYEEVGLMSLSTSDYSQVQPLVHTLAARLQDRRVSISLPSLRADSVSVQLAHAVSRVRKAGFTIAPEAGSDRLRRVINKPITSDDMVNAARAAFSRGWNLIKVYAMVGLPTETDDDLEALAQLAEELAAAGREIRGGKAQVKVSVGCFVPKAWTPFQWEAFVPAQEQRRRLALLRDRFKRIRSVRLTWTDPEEAALEALLARGDRSLAATIERAYQLGALFDGWSDQLDLSAWWRAIEDTGIDLDAELGAREVGAVQPWHVIDAGVRTSFLRGELVRAHKGQTTPDCKLGQCTRCGIPGDGDEIRLAKPPGEVPEPARPTAHGEPQPPVYRRYRITFCKQGDARFLSHRQCMDVLERALRGARAPVRFTEGFNPHIRLSMGPPLSTGHEGLAELFDVDCVAPLRPNVIDGTNRLLPEGLQLLDARDLLPGAPSLGKMVAAARYRVPARSDTPWPDTPPQLPEEWRDGVNRWQLLPDGRLRVELNLRREEGPAPTIKQLLAALGVAEETVPVVRVTREQLILRPRTSRKRGKRGGAR